MAYFQLFLLLLLLLVIIIVAYACMYVFPINSFSSSTMSSIENSISIFAGGLRGLILIILYCNELSVIGRL